MEITYRNFIDFCPSAACPDDHLFDSLKPFIEEAWSEVEADYFTEDISQAVASCDFDPSMDAAPHSLEYLTKCAVKHVCLVAYLRAIPSLDLILTPNGFGVVSNQTKAPASKERVAALTKSIDRGAARSWLSLVNELRRWDGWATSVQAKHLIPCLRWPIEAVPDGSDNGDAVPRFSSLTVSHRMVHEDEIHVQWLISDEFYDELLSAIRGDALTPEMSDAVSLCCDFSRASFHSRARRYARISLISYLDAHISAFPTYRKSLAYEANHADQYKNKADDPCFFF